MDFAVASHLARWLTIWTASASLTFMVPLPDGVAWLALLATPVTGVCAFSIAAVGLGDLSPWWIGTSVLWAVVGVVRRVRGRDASGDFALWLWTPAGPVPVNLTLRLVAGWDAVALGAVGAFALQDGAAFRMALVVALLYAAGIAARGRRRR